MDDIIADEGLLFLGTRLKRLGERMQADVTRIIAEAGVAVQPPHYPILAALERKGASSVGELAAATGTSQPAITRNLGRLVEMSLVETRRSPDDQRQTIVALTAAGADLLALSKARVWPQVEAAVAELCAPLSGSLLAQLAQLDAGLATAPLDRRAATGPGAGLRIRRFEPALAGAFHDINAAWIAAMFTLEPTDREVLENPHDRIVAPGGDILFVETDAGEIIGTCALQKTGERQFELTKMGVTPAARGRKAGEVLLRAILRRAREMEARTLYLLTNSACAPAIHLYGKLGFVHDAGIMAQFGARYARCDVAMLYRAGSRPPAYSATFLQFSRNRLDDANQSQ